MIIPRWKVTSYCLCPTSKNQGHFERNDEGVWVLYEEHEAEIKRLREGLELIKRYSDGTSLAWTLAYEALNNRAYSRTHTSNERP